MPTVKTVEVGFTFAYVDKRRKYTCKSQRRREIHLIKRPGRLCDWVFFSKLYYS